MSLFDATRHLHHVCEQHTIGTAMSSATISRQSWCDWLGALKILHSAIDPELPPYVQVVGELNMDLVDMLPMLPNTSKAAHRFSKTLKTPKSILGAAYVLVGAHRRGGRVTEKRFEDAGRKLPIRHVRFFAAKEAEEFVKLLREKESLTLPAQNTFSCLLSVMDEIEHLSNFQG